MELGILNRIEIEFIKTSLLTNDGIGDEEFKTFSKRHPSVVTNYDDSTIRCEKEYYGTHDIEFNNFLIDKFGSSDWDLDSFYKLTYNVGDYTIPHIDFANRQTTIILLSDDFTGGELVLDGSDIEMNVTGKYVNFLGSEVKHGVNKIISGKREVMVVWFYGKKSLI